MLFSIFNDVIGPIMRGPSSSHTAASVRIGHLARFLLDDEPVGAVFRFDPSGSLATTYRGQGSAMGLAGGLLGMDVNDERLINSEKIARERGLNIEYLIEDYGATHPNTYRTSVEGKNGKKVDFTALSTGGGIVRLVELNGEIIKDDSDYINRLMPVKTDRSATPLFSNLAEAIKFAGSYNGRLSDIAKEYEKSVGMVSLEDIQNLAAQNYHIMRDAIENGLKGTIYRDRILHHQSQLIKKASRQNLLIADDLTNSIISSITAIMETKSSMGVIVAAPTAGACGTLGGTLIPVAAKLLKGEPDICNAILAAGITGILIDMGAGFAAEEGGCQYECGSASGMTAAALIELAGGDSKKALAAASMALQNTLGMICDPVADRVEIPCLGKNIMAGLNALAAANMVLAGYDAVIPVDQVIRAMKEVALSMDHRYRCTCKGGLSVTDAARDIASRLESNQKI